MLSLCQKDVIIMQERFCHYVTKNVAVMLQNSMSLSDLVRQRRWQILHHVVPNVWYNVIFLYFFLMVNHYVDRCCHYAWKMLSLCKKDAVIMQQQILSSCYNTLISRHCRSHIQHYVVPIVWCGETENVKHSYGLDFFKSVKDKLVKFVEEFIIYIIIFK